jgi:hypothetical protein
MFCGSRLKTVSIFERFYRVDKARSHQLVGKGLVLGIVKHIAHAHCGRVFVDSIPGEGSTFSMYPETFEKCSILFKTKAGENFNHRHTLSISRIKI